MSKPRILVVDDEPDVEALISQKFRRQMRKGELEFIFASDGQQALELLGDEVGVTMVLSDINMPRMDGLTLLQRLNESHSGLDTVIVSAYGDMGNIRSAMNLGAFDFLTKPIEFDDLEVTITKTLSHAQMIHDLNEERRAAEHAKTVLSRFFSPIVAQTLAENPECLKPGGERRVATFMFTDLADFTPLVEGSETEAVVDLLNEYIDNVTRIIFKHDGAVNKVVGDAVHAIFGAPLDDPEHARKAVACALAIDAFALEFKQKKNDEGIPLGVTRIGINSGPAILGNFGSESFFDYTAHGDAVNVAARLENANKHLGTRICVSQSVVDQIEDFKGRPAGTLLLKGKSEPLKAYEPLSDERYDDPATAAYVEAYSKLEKSDPVARQAFAALLGKYDEDPLTLFHLGRTIAGENDAVIELQ